MTTRAPIHHVDVAAIKRERARIIQELLAKREQLSQEIAELDVLLRGMGHAPASASQSQPTPLRRPVEEYRGLLQFLELQPRSTIGEVARGAGLDYNEALSELRALEHAHYVMRSNVDGKFPRYELTAAGLRSTR